MEKRENYLSELKSYTEETDKELTMILQSLQWDRNHLLEGPAMAICKHDQSHRLPLVKRKEHEYTCFYKQQGYSSYDTMLPDPLDINANTLVKLNNEDVTRVLDAASKLDPSFKKVSIIFMAMNSSYPKGCMCSPGPEPASLARLQTTYSADERRAIYDAVVSSVPSCHDLADLALLIRNGEDGEDGKGKSRMEILAELRNMRRRRAKYRGAAKTRNYSDVLQDIIKTQMEFYTDAHSDASIAMPKENRTGINKQTDNSKRNEHNDAKQMHKIDCHEYNRYKDSRETFEDRGSGWMTEQRNEGSNETNRYVKRSRDKRSDGREEFNKRIYEGRDYFRGSSKCKEVGSSISDRAINKGRSRDRRYDNRSESIKTEVEESYSRRSKHRDGGRSHRSDIEKERSKKRKYESRESVKIEYKNKYDKYKSRDSKRHYQVESQTSGSSRHKGVEEDQSQTNKEYRRYYDVLDHNNHDEGKQSK